MKYIIIPISVLFIAYSSWNYADSKRPCDQFINSNARIDAKSYKRPHSRTTADQYTFLGETYKRAHLASRPGDVTIDSGAGFGIASIEDASKGLVGIAVNTQDFWTNFANMELRNLYDEAAEEVENIALKLKISMSGLHVKSEEVWNRSSLSLVNAITTVDFTRAERIELRKRILAYVNKLKESGNFRYLTGFSEVELQKVTNSSVYLIRDLYGAYFYSADKLILLDLYYSKLVNYGLAAIRISTIGNSSSAASYAISSFNNKERFEYLLVRRYPSVFHMERVYDGEVLFMRKDSSIKELGLSKRFELDRSRTKMRVMKSTEKTEVPESWFIERSH